MIAHKKAVLLDMNGTFMFGQDRFGHAEDFSIQYRKLGGIKYANEVNEIIRRAYTYLDERYREEAFQYQFPSVASAIQETGGKRIEPDEVERMVATFAYHELGYIPDEYVSALHDLHQHVVLAAVIDIWAPKSPWLTLFREAGIDELFSVMYFSSDHGIVKPSPRPFEIVLSEINISPTDAVMIGDFPRRDLGGAKRAGVDCILVGGATHSDAMLSLDSLLAFARVLCINNT